MIFGGDSMKNTIVNLVRETLEIGYDEQVMLEDDLCEKGLDSIKAIELVVGLEDLYDIQIYDEDLLVSNFSSIQQILNLLNKYI